MGSDEEKSSQNMQGLKLRRSSLLHETAKGNAKHNHPLMLLDRDNRSDVAPVGIAQNEQTELLFAVISNWSCVFLLGRY